MPSNRLEIFACEGPVARSRIEFISRSPAYHSDVDKTATIIAGVTNTPSQQ